MPLGAPQGSSGVPPRPLQGLSLEDLAAEPSARPMGRSPLPPTLHSGLETWGWGWGLASELQPLARYSVCDADGQTERHSNPEVSELIIKQLGTIDTILSLCFLVGIFGVCFNI